MVSWARAVTKHITVEELPNALTHGFGLLCSILGFIVLLVVTLIRGGKWQIISCAIYGVTLICVYAASTLYHGVSSPRWKKGFLLFDHCAIYLLIAGTYTPFVLIALRGAWGWSLFGIIWMLAACGVACELTPLRRSRRLMVALYIGMGWVGLIALKPLVAALPGAGLWLLFGGGVSYTLGVAFYAWRRLRYHHAIWHLFVLGGSVLQYLAVLWYVLPGR